MKCGIESGERNTTHNGSGGQPPPRARSESGSAEVALANWLDQAWAHHPTMGSVEVQGAAVRYRGWSLHHVDRPGLVFVHGFLAHSRWWDHIAPHFADRYRVIAPDFTGMGDSDWRPSYCRFQFADEIVAVARAAGFEGATLVAHSFGAACALFAAKIAPDVFRRVIVIDGRVFNIKEVLPSYVQRRYPSLDEALSRFRLSPPGAWPQPAVLAYVARNSLRQNDDATWDWKFDPAVARFAGGGELCDALRGARLAADFVHASHSEVVKAKDLSEFRQLIPTCGVPVTIPLSHHHIMFEQPVALVAAIDALLTHPNAGERL